MKPRGRHIRARATSRRGWQGKAIAPALVLALAGCAWPGHAADQTDAGASAPASPSVAASTTPAPTPTPTPTPSPSPAQADPAPVVTPTPTPTPSTPAAPPAEAAAPPADPTPSAPPAPQSPKRGSSGQAVAAVQQRLQDLGYGFIKPDGSYGSSTQQAVWAFQKAAGLSRDGVIGPKTQQLLDEGFRPKARSTSGKVVEIDLQKQILLAVEDGHVVRVINASSGSGKPYEALGKQYKAVTPKGSFKVTSQDNGMHESTLELGNMWRPKYFNGAIAVHGSGSIPPYPASHGCVRVSNTAMNWLWDTWGMPIGTPVLVY